MTMRKKEIGFIGLGEMGKPMAEHLLNAGFNVTVCDLVKERVEALAKAGARPARLPEQLAASDVIFIMVPGNRETEQVLFGQNGVWQELKPGAIIIITNTIDPVFYKTLGPKAKEAGVGVLDAPVSGSRLGAEAGTLTFMVGGDEDLFKKCIPVFKAMGKNFFYQGDLGTGQIVKFVNNALLYINWVGAAEAITFGLKCGLKPDRIMEVVATGTGNSWALQHLEFLSSLDRKSSKKTMGQLLEIAKREGVYMPTLGVVSQVLFSSWPQYKKPIDSDTRA